MGYEVGKDKIVKEYENISLSASQDLVFVVRKYNNGTNKLDIKRRIVTSYSKHPIMKNLGRVSSTEADLLMPRLIEFSTEFGGK